VLDDWITTVATERNGYREAMREAVALIDGGRCKAAARGLRAALPAAPKPEDDDPETARPGQWDRL
jgi:hypothetical protein